MKAYGQNPCDKAERPHPAGRGEEEPAKKIFRYDSKPEGGVYSIKVSYINNATPNRILKPAFLDFKH